MTLPENTSPIRPDRTSPQSEAAQLPATVDERVAGARVVPHTTDGRNAPTPPSTDRVPAVLAAAKPRHKGITERTNDPTPGQSNQDEFTKIAAMRTTIPEIGEIPDLGEIPNYETVQQRIGTVALPAFTEDHNSPFDLLDGLRLQPREGEPNYDAEHNVTLTREEYISVAGEALREIGYSEDDIAYAREVGFPSLIALHSTHAKSGYEGVIFSFAERLQRLTEFDEQHTPPPLRTEIATAIDFVRRRDEITSQIYKVFTDWIDGQRNGLIDANPIQAIIVDGSFPGGYATYISDVDVQLFSQTIISPQQYEQFARFANERIHTIAPTLSGIGTIGPSDTNPTFILSVAEFVRAQLEDADVEINRPGYRNVIFASDTPTRELLERATAPRNQ